MANKKYGLVGVGNALVDILTNVDEAFIVAQSARGMEKGRMTLIDTKRAQELFTAMTEYEVMPGGSAANSVAMFAAFRHKAAGFIGKTANDQLGKEFRATLQADGIAYTTPLLAGEDETGRCYIMISPGGERTMNTYLGANGHFAPADVDAQMVRDAEFVLLEGYLYDKPGAKAAFEKVARIAKAEETQVAMTLSDANCVKRHLADFRAMVRGGVDIVFASSSEIKAYAETEDFDAAARFIMQDVKTAVLTRGGQGALILSGGKAYEIDPVKADKVVSTNGAGDAFAGGVLAGISMGLDFYKCGKLGALAATEVLGHVGGRAVGVDIPGLVRKL